MQLRQQHQTKAPLTLHDQELLQSSMRTCRRRLRLPSRLYPSRVATKGISAKAAPNTLHSIVVPKPVSVSGGSYPIL